MPAKDLTIRPATSADAAALNRIKVTSWRKAYEQIFPSSFFEGLDYSQQYWDRHLGRLLVSESRRGITGYCSYAPADEQDWGEIKAIYVSPLAQNLGHGTLLLQASLTALSEMGFEKALLWVIDRNHPARRFYEARGWVLGAPIRLEEIGETAVTLVRYELDPITIGAS